MTKLGASGILVRDGREFLLGRREAKDEALPGMWCTPGGGVEEGEAINAAIAREFREETGLIVSVGSLVAVTERFSERGHSVLVFKQVHLKTDTKPIVGEGFDQIKWFSASELAQVDGTGTVTPATEEAIWAFMRTSMFTAVPYDARQ